MKYHFLIYLFIESVCCLPLSFSAHCRFIQSINLSSKNVTGREIVTECEMLLRLVQTSKSSSEQEILLDELEELFYKQLPCTSLILKQQLLFIFPFSLLSIFCSLVFLSLMRHVIHSIPFIPSIQTMFFLFSFSLEISKCVPCPAHQEHVRQKCGNSVARMTCCTHNGSIKIGDTRALSV